MSVTNETIGNSGTLRLAFVCVLLLALSGLIFFLNPGFDLAVSQAFYTPGRGFVWGKSMPIVIMRDIGLWITGATIVALVGLGIWWTLRPDAKSYWLSATPDLDWAFLFTTLAIGPGFFVHVVFKHFWGRARPVHIEQFGGLKHFTPAWVISDQCGPWNCSFVSGEAAASAMIFAFCVVAPERWKKPVFIAALAVTAMVSFARVAAGGHFLSDVVTAWLLMFLVIWAVRALIYGGTLSAWLAARLPAR